MAKTNNLQVINTFEKGMNQDLAKIVQPKNTYFNAKGWRSVTTEGQSNMSLETILGNTEFKKLPVVYSVWKFYLHDLPELIDDVWEDTVTIKASTEIRELDLTGNFSTTTNYFNTLAAEFAQGTPLYLAGYRIASHKDNYIVIWNIDKNISSITSTYGTSLIKTEAQKELIPIAYTAVRDDLYIISTSRYLPKTSRPAQIWKLTYDATLCTYTSLDMIYAEAMNIDMDYPIRKMTSIYENENTIRLYWTDNNNSIKTINVADKNLMAFPIELSELTPNVFMSKPVLSQIITGGSLLAGLHQIAYRLKRQGAATLFSPLSNMIPIVSALETTADTERYKYYGDGSETVTSKALIFIIDNIDTNYEEIDIVSIYHSSETSDPLVKIIETTKISSSGELTVTYTGQEITINSSVDEIIDFNQVYTCADMISKENNMILLNAKLKSNTDISFNARAYRYNSTQTTYVSDAFADPDDAATIQEIKDGINPFNNNTEIEAAANLQYKFQSDGTTLGGEGPNISYKIIAHEIEGHKIKEVLPALPLDQKDKSSDTITLDNIDVNLTMWKDFKSPYIASTLKGYARGEVYRFGIVFFDKKGIPSFTKWIGDIKFPYLNDETVIPVRAHGRIADYTTEAGKLAGAGGNFGEQKLLSLGIEFTVDVSSIADQITGYSIVRVKRDQSNKTVLGMGMRINMYNYSGDTYGRDSEGNAITDDFFIPHGGGEIKDSASRGNTPYFTFDSPDFMFGASEISPNAGDLMRFEHYLENAEANGVFPTIDSSGTLYANQGVIFNKYVYHTAHLFPELHNIEELIYLERGASTTNINGARIRNYTGYDGDTAADYACNMAIGSKTTYIQTNGALGACTAPYAPYNTNKWLGTYVRPLLEQYGGNTEYARSLNTYIRCSNFVRVQSTSTIITTDVMGGDTYVINYPAYKFTGNVDYQLVDPTIFTLNEQFSAGSGTAAGFRMSGYIAAGGFIFPCESAYNVDLRNGKYMYNNIYNSYFIDFFDGGILEDYEMNRVFNKEDVVVPYIPKPINFDEILRFDTRIYASNTKVPGETIDSWRTYQTYKDVHGLYGPLTYGAIIKETFVFFQEKACGVLQVLPRTVINDTDGTPFQLAQGSVLDNYSYLSTFYGTIHKPIVSDNSLIYFDKYSRKLLQIKSQGGVNQLSDIKGINSFLFNEINGNILNIDNPHLGIGLSGTYERRFNEYCITFKNYEILTTYSTIINTANPTDTITVLPATYNVLNVGDILRIRNNYEYIVTIEEKLSSNRLKLNNKVFLSNNAYYIDIIEIKDYTITYNEFVDAFISFHDFYPNLYITNNDILLTSNSTGTLYVHNKGNYGEFYGNAYQSTLDLIPNAYASETKVFDSISMHIESAIIENKRIIDKPISMGSIRMFTDYQNTGWYIPSNEGIYKTLTRIERDWNLPIPGDAVIDSSNDILDENNINTSATFKPRLRDKYLTINLKFNNIENIRTILHLIKTRFRISAH